MNAMFAKNILESLKIAPVNWYSLKIFPENKLSKERVWPLKKMFLMNLGGNPLDTYQIMVRIEFCCAHNKT